MHRTLLAILLPLALTASLRAGSVTLNDGKTLQGTVSLATDGGGEIQLQTPNNPAQNFKFTDVKAALFDGLAGGITLGGSGVPWVRTEIRGGGLDRRAPIANIAGDKITITEPPAAEPATAKPAAKKAADEAPAPSNSLAVNSCFVFQKLDWDGEILAHIAFDGGTGGGGGHATAGLLICEGLDGQGPMALVTRSNDAGGGVGVGSTFTRRSARTEEISLVGATHSPEGGGASWLKLTRSWDSLRALESADGVTWTPVGEARIEMDDRKGVYIGVAARGENSRITFENLKLAGRRAAAVTPGEADPRLRDVSVMLKDGTILAGMLESVTPDGQGQIKIASRPADAQRVTLKPNLIARAQFAPMNAEQTQTFLAANVGALTKDGDFLEGELKDIKNGTVTVSSITFGLTTLEPGRVLGIVLQAPDEKPPARSHTEVRLQDGSLIMADGLKVDKNQLVIEEPLIGPLNYPLQEVISISRK
jgi:hypothetical protein